MILTIPPTFPPPNIQPHICNALESHAADDEEGNETVTNCNGLKTCVVDGKMRMTDVADAKQLFHHEDRMGYFLFDKQKIAFHEFIHRS